MRINEVGTRSGVRGDIFQDQSKIYQGRGGRGISGGRVRGRSGRGHGGRGKHRCSRQDARIFQ